MRLARHLYPTITYIRIDGEPVAQVGRRSDGLYDWAILSMNIVGKSFHSREAVEVRVRHHLANR